MLLGGYAKLTNAANIASTNYHYRSREATWGTVATSGEVDCEHSNYRLLSYRLATITSAGVGYRVEGRFSNDGRWISIYSASVTAVDTIDTYYTITPPMYELRVGWRCEPTPTATVNNIIYSDLYLPVEGA